MVPFIESVLDKDYYYLLDWADIQCQLSPRAAKSKCDLELSAESEEVMSEADNYNMKFGMDETDAVCILAALILSWLCRESTLTKLNLPKRDNIVTFVEPLTFSTLLNSEI